MSKNSTYSTRRRAARWQCNDLPVTWQRQGRQPRRPGWLFDISDTGLAYLAGAKGLPSSGERVQVTPRHSSDEMHCRVIRIEPLRSGLCLVGCRRVERVESMAKLPPDSPRDAVMARRSTNHSSRMAA